LLKESTEASSTIKEAPAGIVNKFIILKVLLVEDFCINNVTVAALLACILAIKTEAIPLAPSPGAISSTVGWTDPTML
tara:strand:+ start:488 stop:721 length:234 start_codon:yes stop_codon:yes gene_type:complete